MPIMNILTEIRPRCEEGESLTVGKVSVDGFTINAKVTVSSGTLGATGHITTAQLLAPSAPCKAGRALVKHHGTRSCVLASFPARILRIRVGGAYTVSLSPDAAAKRALNAGQTLHVTETLTLSTAPGLKPMRQTFNVAVHRQINNKKRQ
jgi:hypothetical protein